MTLKNYQQAISVGVLYAIELNTYSGTEQVAQNLEVIGGTVDVYGSQIKPVSSPTSEMSINEVAFTGIAPFGVIPNYFYLAANTGTVTSVTLSGVKATVVTL